MVQNTENPDETSSHETDTDGWTDRLAGHKTGLAALSFAESTVVPIPLETIVAPLMIGHPRRSIAIAIAIWIGCLAGASLFYFVGLWLRDPVVLPAIAWLGLTDSYENLSNNIDSEGVFWTVFLVSFSPAPMQIATLGTGTVGGNFLAFFAAIAASRGIRYFGLAILAQLLGDRISKLNISKKKLIPVVMVLLLAAWAAFQILPI